MTTATYGTVAFRYGSVQHRGGDPQQIHDRRWLICGALCLSLLLVGIDNTILNVALPTLVNDLGASTSDLQWIVDSYVLVFAGLLLTAGSLGDRNGRRRALVAGLVVFGIASVLSAFSGSAGQLIGSRALMGAAAAFIMPSTLSILTNVFSDPTERARAIAVWAGVAGLGIGIGPLAGGYLLEHFWWGSVFLVNVPVIVVAIVLALQLVPESKDPTHAPLDVPGALLSIAGLVTLVWSLIEAPNHGWLSTTTLGGFAVAAAILTTFALWERRTPHPMLDVSFFADPRFTAGSAAITIAFFALFGALFLVTQFLQFVLGYSPLEAGTRLLPIAATLAIVAPNSARLVEKIGTKYVVAGGMVIIAVGLFLSSRLTVGATDLELIGSMIVMATGMSLVMAPATEAIMGSLPPAKAGVGSAVNDTTREVGGALGVAVLGSVASSRYGHGMADVLDGAPVPAEVRHLIEDSLGAAIQVADRVGGEAGATLADAARLAFVDGTGVTMLVGTAVCLAGAVLALLFLPARAAEGTEVDETEERTLEAA